jgi:hypothetical protein
MQRTHTWRGRPAARSTATAPAVVRPAHATHRDALYCESYLAPLLDELKYSINLNFHFIGEKAVRACVRACVRERSCVRARGRLHVCVPPTPRTRTHRDTQADGSWSCKHGQEECDGNLHQLCVQSYSRDYNRVNWLLHFILVRALPSPRQQRHAARLAVGQRQLSHAVVRSDGDPLVARSTAVCVWLRTRRHSGHQRLCNPASHPLLATPARLCA